MVKASGSTVQQPSGDDPPVQILCQDSVTTTGTTVDKPSCDAPVSSDESSGSDSVSGDNTTVSTEHSKSTVQQPVVDQRSGARLFKESKKVEIGSTSCDAPVLSDVVDQPPGSTVQESSGDDPPVQILCQVSVATTETTVDKHDTPVLSDTSSDSGSGICTEDSKSTVQQSVIDQRSGVTLLKQSKKGEIELGRITDSIESGSTFCDAPVPSDDVVDQPSGAREVKQCKKEIQVGQRTAGYNHPIQFRSQEPGLRFVGEAAGTFNLIVRGSGSRSSESFRKGENELVRSQEEGSGAREAKERYAANTDPAPVANTASTFKLFLREPTNSSSGLVGRSENQSAQSKIGNFDATINEFERAGRLRGFSFSGLVQNDQLQYIRSHFAREVHDMVMPGPTVLGLLLQLGQFLVISVLQQQIEDKKEKYGLEKGEKTPIEILQDDFFKIVKVYGVLLYIYFGAKLLLRIIPQLPPFSWRHVLCFVVDEIVSVPCGLASLAVLNRMFKDTNSVAVGIMFLVLYLLHLFIGLYNVFKDTNGVAIGIMFLVVILLYFFIGMYNVFSTIGF